MSENLVMDAEDGTSRDATRTKDSLTDQQNHNKTRLLTVKVNQISDKGCGAMDECVI